MVSTMQAVMWLLCPLWTKIEQLRTNWMQLVHCLSSCTFMGTLSKCATENIKHQNFEIGLKQWFFFTNNPLVEAGGMQPSAVSVDQHQNSSECVFMTWPLARGRGHSWQLGALIQLTQLLLQLFHCKHFHRNYRLALLLLLHL